MKTKITKVKPAIRHETSKTTVQVYPVKGGTRVTVGIKTGQKPGPHKGADVFIPNKAK